MNSFINSENSLAIWAVIIAFVFFTMYSERKFKWAKTMGAALLCLVGGMILSSIGFMPTSAPAYGVIWGYVTPVALPLVLFKADIRKIAKESGKMLFMFLIASSGTVIGAIVASLIFGAGIPELHKVAAIFTGSQTGGSMNIIVMADVFGISETMFNAVYLADILTYVFTLFVLTILPTIGFIRKKFKCSYPATTELNHENDVQSNDDMDGMHVFGLVKALAISFAIVAVSVAFANFVKSLDAPEIIHQLFGQKYLIITLLTVIIATTLPSHVGKIKGAQEFGLFMMYIFFVAISLEADLRGVVTVGPRLILFSSVTFAGILSVSLLLGKLFNFSIEEISVGANAALGGPTTAAAVAATRGWKELVTPAILVGTLGYILGNYFGVFVGNFVLKITGM